MRWLPGPIGFAPGFTPSSLGAARPRLAEMAAELAFESVAPAGRAE